MEKKRKICEYRDRLDKTLASPDLTNEEKIRALVKNQLLRSSHHEVAGLSENVLEKRTLEVANFLDMLRSVSLNEDEAPVTHDTSHPEWKLKQDTEEFRVMYREGTQGTPFHTLLVEGYVDGPVDECLCVSWESGLYKKWWPQSMVPTFKIISSKCMQKVRIGEQISLVRMKVPWPLSAREALVHYFELEYTRDDLVVVLVNTISDVESVDKDTHGFSKDELPEAKDVVRIDLVGGFVIQKVTPERSYFRTIMRMDIKVDFIPPSLMNFVARQLIGNGFRLYEKTVVSAFKTDEDFSKALADPLYVRIRKAPSSNDEQNGVLEEDDLNSDTFSLPEEHPLGSTIRDGVEEDHHNGESEDQESESSANSVPPIVKKASCEIEEEGDSEDEDDDDDTSLDQDLVKTHATKCHVNDNKKVVVSPKVEEALGTLDKVICLIQEYGFNTPTRDASDVTNVESSSSDREGLCAEVSRKELVEKSSQELRNSSSGQDLRSSKSDAFSGEVNLAKHNETHPVAMPLSTNEMVEEKIRLTGDVNGVEKSSLPPLSPNEMVEGKTRLTGDVNGVGKSSLPPLSTNQMVENKTRVTSDVNGLGKSSLPGGVKSGRRTKHRVCCF